MTFFKRMFSADFRRAVAAEAAGDFAEAARAYALAGERAKVAEIHLTRAERAPSPEGRLHELRAAVRWADPTRPDGRVVRRRIARALAEWARSGDLHSDSVRAVVREAAQLFAECGDHVGAGGCHELVGAEAEAAEAYQRAGDVERLEAVLQREETRRKRAQRLTAAFDEYRLGLAGGERDRALTALKTAIDCAVAGEKADLTRLAESLEARLLTRGQVALRGARGETRYLGAWPLCMGREASCELVLRDLGISRRHAEITADPGGFRLRDLDSHNGTLLAGVRVGGSLPLPQSGELGIGEACALRFSSDGGLIVLEVVRGLDRGLQVRAGLQPLDVEGVAELRFVDGRPRLAARPGQALTLSGVHAGGAVQLIRGDRLQIGDLELEVV